MRALPWLALLAATVPGQDRVVVTVTAKTLEPYVGQPVAIALRIAYDRDWFAEHGVPLLQRRVDVPFHVALDWEGFGDAAGDGPRIVVGDREVRAARRPGEDRDGRAFEVLELTAEWLGEAPGPVRLQAPRVSYAYATAFEQTLLSGRQPVDRHQAGAVGTALELVVREVPTSGRPPSFTGAVGDFTVDVEVPDRVEVGDSFTLTLVVAGGGNLQRFAAPPWPELDGFAVQGMTEQRLGARRRFAFDVLALRAAAPPPAIPFAFFSPAAAQFRTIDARATALQVVARDPARPLAPRVQRLLEAAAGTAEAGRSSAWWYIAAAFAGLAVLYALRRRRA